MTRNTFPYRGHPIAAIIAVTFLTPLRSIKAYLINLPVVLPIAAMLLGQFLPSLAVIIIGTIAFIFFDMCLLGFTHHEDLKYKFAEKYGNHKTAFFSVYELLVFAVVIGINGFLIYKVVMGQMEMPYAIISEALTIPWACAQFPLIRAINEFKCKKCGRAGIMSIASTSDMETRYEADYKTVWGHDRHVGTVSHNDTNIEVYRHVPTHREFDGFSRVSSNHQQLICMCCGSRRIKYNSYRTKV